MREAIEHGRATKTDPDAHQITSEGADALIEHAEEVSIAGLFHMAIADHGGTPADQGAPSAAPLPTARRGLYADDGTGRPGPLIRELAADEWPTEPGQWWICEVHPETGDAYPPGAPISISDCHAISDDSTHEIGESLQARGFHFRPILTAAEIVDLIDLVGEYLANTPPEEIADLMISDLRVLLEKLQNEPGTMQP